MKASLKTTMIVAASIAFGAGAVQLLHAAGSPPAFIVAEINVKDRAGYDKDFLPEAQKLIKEHGGVYIAGGHDKAKAIEGAPAQNRVVVFRFDSMDGLMKWWNSGAHKLNDDVGKKFADFRILAVEGIEAK
jgi:uncharacterized protein (DUF1330 family)